MRAEGTWSQRAAHSVLPTPQPRLGPSRTLLVATTPTPRLLGSSVPVVMFVASAVVMDVVVVVEVVVSMSSVVKVTPALAWLPDTPRAIRSSG